MKLKSFALPFVVASVLTLGACSNSPSATKDEPATSSTTSTQPYKADSGTGATTLPDKSAEALDATKTKSAMPGEAGSMDKSSSLETPGSDSK